MNWWTFIIVAIVSCKLYLLIGSAFIIFILNRHVDVSGTFIAQLAPLCAKRKKFSIFGNGKRWVINLL